MTLVAKYELLRNQGASAETIHAVVRADAIRLAGGPDDMVQRALVYHYVYKLSGDAFVFPLIAAHGALWARWYLIAARFAACILGAVDISHRGSRARRLATYGIYVDTLKSINQRVMIEVFTVVHVLLVLGPHPLIEDHVSEALISQLLAAQAKSERGAAPAIGEQRALYEAFFRWEQIRVVAPLIDTAMAQFDWPLMRWLCMRPWVWFSYFKFGRSLNFRDFSDAEERVQKGLAAFDLAALKGFAAIETNLVRNPLFPRAYFADPEAYLSALREPEFGSAPAAGLSASRSAPRTAGKSRVQR